MSVGAEVRAILVDSLIGGPAGSIKFYETAEHQPAGFNFVCPCGCGGIGGVTVAAGGWEWNGSRDRPTVRPSVFFNRGAPGEWHGFLTDGVWRQV